MSSFVIIVQILIGILTIYEIIFGFNEKEGLFNDAGKKSIHEFFGISIGSINRLIFCAKSKYLQ